MIRILLTEYINFGASVLQVLVHFSVTCSAKEEEGHTKNGKHICVIRRYTAID
jgi:hypothetical protein